MKLDDLLKEDAKPQAIQKIRYTHDAMIDLIITKPEISQGEIARSFGYSEGWVSQILASDAFQAKLAERKEELVDPSIRATVEERMKALVIRSLDILQKKMEGNPSDNLVLRSLELGSKGLGLGQKAPIVQQPVSGDRLEVLSERLVVLFREKKGETYEGQATSTDSGKTAPPALSDGE